MDQPVDTRHLSMPAWIECLNDTLNGLLVAALVIASITQMGLLYQGGKTQFRSFSLARVLCGSGQQYPLCAPQRVQRIAFEIVSSGVSMSS